MVFVVWALLEMVQWWVQGGSKEPASLGLMAGEASGAGTVLGQRQKYIKTTGDPGSIRPPRSKAEVFPVKIPRARCGKSQQRCPVFL